MPCRINKKREWKGRNLLEASHSPVNGSFVTLTYNDDHLPKDGSLVKRDVQNYLKRFRLKFGGGLRYFAVGEYGEINWRPHYHLLLFNAAPWDWEKQIIEAWQPRGFVTVYEINVERCNYVCDYATKRLTIAEDPRLGGRNREFFLSSRRPPIGHLGYLQLLDAMYTRSGSISIAKTGDVPSSFRFDGNTYPICRRWRARMRDDIGIPAPGPGDRAEKTIIALNKTDEQRMQERLRKYYEQAEAQSKAEKLWREHRRKQRARRTL
jgi:hypothetical protein